MSKWATQIKSDAEVFTTQLKNQGKMKIGEQDAYVVPKEIKSKVDTGLEMRRMKCVKKAYVKNLDKSEEKKQK